MVAVKITQDRDACIGCGACVAVCPANWEMVSDGKSQAKNSNPKDLGCNLDAAKSCPVTCIHVEQDGKKLI